MKEIKFRIKEIRKSYRPESVSGWYECPDPERYRIGAEALGLANQGYVDNDRYVIRRSAMFRMEIWQIEMLGALLEKDPGLDLDLFLSSAENAEPFSLAEDNLHLLAEVLRIEKK